MLLATVSMCLSVLSDRSLFTQQHPSMADTIMMET